MADRGAGSPRGFDRRTVLRTSALAAGVVWTRPVVRTIGLPGATGTPPPSTTTPTTSEPPPVMLVEAVSICRGTANFAYTVRISGFEPFTQYAHNHGAGFTTDGDGFAQPEELDHTFDDAPSTMFLTIWPDSNGNLIQDPSEPTVFSGSFVNDRPCKQGPFLPD